MPKYAMRGVPDVIVIRDGEFIGLEVKTDVGRGTGPRRAPDRRRAAAGL
jgi:hypothetical protein